MVTHGALHPSTWNGILATLASGPGSVANVRTFGARGDGSDDTSAIRAAMSALTTGGTLVFPPGRYVLSGEVAGLSNVEVVGYDATLTSTSRLRSFFYFGHCTKVTVRNLSFDLGQPVLPAYRPTDYPAPYNQAVYAYRSSDVAIVDCVFTNLYTQGLSFFECHGTLDLLRNRHSSPVQRQSANLQHVRIQTCDCTTTIDDCDFNNAAPTSADVGVAGVAASGTTAPMRCVNSRFDYCGRNSAGRHQLGAFSCYGDDIDVTVKDNVFTNCLQQVVRLTTTHHAEVSGNHFSMAAAAGDGDQIVSIEGTYSFFPGLVGSKDIHVHHNTFVDLFGKARIGVYAGAYDYAIPLEDIEIHDNVFLNMKHAVTLAGPYRRVRVEKNDIRGTNGGGIAYAADPGGVRVTALHGVTEERSKCEELRIAGNVFSLADGRTVPIHLSFLMDHPYKGEIGDIEIADNRARAAAGPATQFVVYRGIAGRGRLTCRNNDADNFTYGFDISNVAALTLVENRAHRIPPERFLLRGGVGALEMHDNSVISASGVATPVV